MFIKTIFQSKLLPHFGDLSEWDHVSTPSLVMPLFAASMGSQLERRMMSIKNWDKHINLMVATNGDMLLRVKGQTYPLNSLFKQPAPMFFYLNSRSKTNMVLAISAKDGMLEWGYGCRVPGYFASKCDLSGIIVPYERFRKHVKEG